MAKTQHIVIVAFDGCQILDVTGPMQVFASANEARDNLAYDITIASMDGTEATATCGLKIAATPLGAIPADTIDTLIMAGGDAVERAAQNSSLVAWIQKAASHAKRVCSVCSGTFVLAKAGLTDGKKVTTHWRAASLLQKLYPTTRVEADALYIKDGTLWSSAGVTAGLDMSLALVEEDLGRPVALQVAKRLVVYAHRPGYQSQFSTLLEGQIKGANSFPYLLEWVANNISSDVSVEKMAEIAMMSSRSFHRKFVSEMGVTPAKYVEQIRLEAARSLLENTSKPLKSIATSTGFKTPLRLIQSFERHLGMSPSTYRYLHGKR